MSQRPTDEREAAQDVLANALGSPPESTRDVGWGEGRSYPVGPDPDSSSRLEVFPASGVVRITASDAQITLFHQPPPTIAGDQVSFEQERAQGGMALRLTRDGRLRLDLIPAAPDRAVDDNPAADDTPLPAPNAVAASANANAIEPPATNRSETAETDPNSPVDDATGPTIPPHPQTTSIGDSGGDLGPLSAPSETVESAVDGTVAPEKPQRLTLTGRLGRVPSFRTTRNGTLIASFPLAVRDEAGETTWHTILAFGERAEHLREGLAKGQHLEVIGYLHQRERTTRSGETRIIDEVYATVVKPR